MPTYRVEQYELHVASYLVENVTSPAAAIERVVQGKVQMEDNGSEFVEVADAYSAPLPAEIIAELRDRGLPVDLDRVPSIRCVEEDS